MASYEMSSRTKNLNRKSVRQQLLGRSENAKIQRDQLADNMYFPVHFWPNRMLKTTSYKTACAHADFLKLKSF